MRKQHLKTARVDTRTLGASEVDLLENVRVGVIQLDRGGGLVAANDRAQALLRQSDGLLDGDGWLRAALPREDVTLQRLLTRALPLRGGTGEGGAMLVSRSQPLSRLVLHVSPMRNAGAKPDRGGAGALVLVVDPTDRTVLDPERVGEALDLTRAQSHVAVLLAQGKSIDEVAALTGRRRSTVKWAHPTHLRPVQDFAADRIDAAGDFADRGSGCAGIDRFVGPSRRPR